MLANAVFSQFVYGSYSLSSINSPHRAIFVQYGFARHKTGIWAAVIDEPLIIFAASTWLKKQQQFSLLDCLRQDTHIHSAHRNGFEAYLAYYIREIFETSQNLDAVFTFRSDFASRTDLSWQYDKFELVTVSGAEVSPITKDSGPSSSIGFIAVSGEEVLEWIKTNDDKYTFCFPPKSFGPDILFHLRCQRSQKLLIAAVKCKKYEEVELKRLIHGLRTVSPPWFWRSRSLEVSHSAILKRTAFYTDISIKMLLARHLCRMIPNVLHLLKQPQKSWRRSYPLCPPGLIMLFYASSHRGLGTLG